MTVQLRYVNVRNESLVRFAAGLFNEVVDPHPSARICGGVFSIHWLLDYLTENWTTAWEPYCGPTNGIGVIRELMGSENQRLGFCILVRGRDAHQRIMLFFRYLTGGLCELYLVSPKTAFNKLELKALCEDTKADMSAFRQKLLLPELKPETEKQLEEMHLKAVDAARTNNPEGTPVSVKPVDSKPLDAGELLKGMRSNACGYLLAVNHYTRVDMSAEDAYEARVLAFMAREEMLIELNDKIKQFFSIDRSPNARDQQQLEWLYAQRAHYSACDRRQIYTLPAGQHLEAFIRLVKSDFAKIQKMQW